MPETKKLFSLPVIIYLEAFGSIWKLTVFAIYLHHFHTENTNERKQYVKLPNASKTVLEAFGSLQKNGRRLAILLFLPPFWLFFSESKSNNTSTFAPRFRKARRTALPVHPPDARFRKGMLCCLFMCARIPSRKSAACVGAGDWSP